MSNLRFRLSDLPPALREQAAEQITPAPKRGASPYAPKKSPPPSATRSPSLRPYPEPRSVSAPPTNDLHEKGMSQTERLYLSQVLHNQARFEPITLRLPGNSRYTPDFLSFDDGVPTLHEVKGSYRLGSQGRAHTAFFEAAAAYSCIFRFVWAEKLPGGASTGFRVQHLVPATPPSPNPFPTTTET